MSDSRIEGVAIPATVAATAVRSRVPFPALFIHVTFWSIFGQYALVFHLFAMPDGSFDTYYVRCARISYCFTRYFGVLVPIPC